MTSTIKVHSKGLPPLDQPIAGLAIAERLQSERERSDAEHLANRDPNPARLRASDSYACARKIAFTSLGVPKDITYDAAQLLTFQVGDWYHQVVEEALVAWFDARCEVNFDWRPTFPLYGRGDAVYDGSVRTAVEIKSQAGYGFDLSTGARKSSDGPGPKLDHLLQVGFAALSPQVMAEQVHVIYVNKDRCTVAEWLVGIDEELPHLEQRTIRQLVSDELERLAGVLADIDDHKMPARVVPGFGLVEAPPASDQRADPWNCRYCSWQPSCATQPSEAFAYRLDADKAVEVVA